MMSGKQVVPQQSKHRGRTHQFLVHLLKITRLPTPLSSSNVDITPCQKAKRDALKVTVLYNSHQIALGDFPVLMNECVIDRKLTCQFSVCKSETQSKFHLYIDQTYSSGLTGHLALDLHEFVREDETEIYLKYPLYANTSRHCRGPVLKIIIRNLGIKNAEPFTDEEDEIFLLPHQSIERLPSTRVCNSEDACCTLQDSRFDLNGRMQPYHLDEASLSQLEGALSEIGEKLRTLVTSFQSRDDSQSGIFSRGDIECHSSTASPLLSSLHTGTSVDSRSEVCEEQCTDSDDVFDSSFDLGSSMYPLSIPKHSRTLSDISTHTSNFQYPQALRQGRKISIEEAFSEPWISQSNTSGESHELKHRCLDECFLCSSAHALHSYEGIQASLSRSKSVSSRPKSLQLNALQATTAKMSVPLDRQPSKKGENGETPVTRKGPGLLRSLFGAVVVAGVSLLGVRNSNSSGERSQSTGMQTKLGRTSRSSLSSDIRSEKFSRHRYSFRR